MTTPETPAAEPTATGRFRRLFERRRLLLALAWSLLVLGVVGGSIGFGWWLATNTAVASQALAKPEIVHVPLVNDLESDVLMPDVRGLTPQDALEVLADAGIDASIVTTTSRPAAGTSGVVLQQTPVFGTPEPAAVELVVSEPAVVPDLTGLDRREAINRLVELGARVEQVAVYDPDAAIDRVVGVEPIAGSALPESVTLTVTAAASSVYFSNLDRDGYCSTSSTLKINGKSYAQGLVCDSSTSGSDTAWQLGNAVDVVTGTLGIPDTEDAASSVRVQILGDGVLLASVDLVYGSSAPIDLRTTGILNLTFRMTALAGASPDVGLGGLLAQGASAPIAALPRY